MPGAEDARGCACGVRRHGGGTLNLMKAILIVVEPSLEETK